MKTELRKPLLALLLLVPAPSLGAAAGLWWGQGTLWGNSLYAASKVWLLAFPLFWHFRICKGKFTLPRVTRQGWREGGLTGLLCAAVILLGAWMGRGRLFDPADIAEALENTGLMSFWPYLLMGVYWSTVNAVLEEMVWRWFVLGQCRKICRRPVGAAALSAFLFTLHHLVIVAAWLPWDLTLLVNLAIFAAGFLWSHMTLRHQSIFPACVSHMLADAGIVAAGVWVLFF